MEKIKYEKISILIPVFNAQKTLKKTTGSALMQKYPNFDILISDNSSDDKSRLILQKIKKKNVKIFYQKDNIGAPKNWMFLTKKGREGHNKDFSISNGSFSTQKIDLSFDGKQDYYDYFIGYTNYSTGGESAMRDNSEKDGYRSDNLTINYGYNFAKNWRLENFLYYNDSFLEYDAVNKSQTDLNDTTDDQQAVYTARLIHDNGKVKNTLSYNNTYVLRNTTDYNNSKKNYYGYRDALNFLSENQVNIWIAICHNG